MPCILCKCTGKTEFMNPPPCNCEFKIHEQCYANLYFDSSYKLCQLTKTNTEHLDGTDAAKCTICDQYFNPPNERMELYDNNILRYSIGYFNGKLHGSFKEFWPNGRLKKLTNVVNGTINGLYTEYNEDGSMKKHCIIMNGTAI